jgi:hypothetical protein
LAEYVKYAVAFGRKRKKTKTAYIRISGISIGLTGEVRKEDLPAQNLKMVRSEASASKRLPAAQTDANCRAVDTFFSRDDSGSALESRMLIMTLSQT